MGKRAAVAAGLVVATFAVYLQVRGHEFVDLDDLQVIVWNENLRPESLGEALTLAFGTTLNANWIPLTTLSLQLDRALFGERAAGFLLGNVALHAATAVALFFALLRLTGAIGRSAFVAGVFALHPLHVESVAWAAARKDPLSGLFFALGLLAYARYVGRPGTTRYLCVFACQALSLLAKPVAVCFPFVLLLLDAWPLGRLQLGDGRAGAEGRWSTPWRRVLVEKLPLIALSAAAGVVTLLVQGEAGAMRQAARIPLGGRVLNAMDATGAYLTDAFWPSGLAVFYPHPLDALPVGRALAWGAALAGITALVLWRRRHSPWLAVGWLWFLVALAPTLGIVQVGVQARADRYTYLPLVGLALAVAWEAVHLLYRLRSPPARGSLAGARCALRLPFRSHPALAVGAVLLLAAQGAVAWVQVGHWRDAVALHSHAVAVTQDNFLEHHRLARALLERGSLVEAEYHFRRSLEIEPRRADPSVGLGDALFRQGHTDDAILAYRAALAREPGNALASAKLGLALVRAGRHREALAPLTAALAEAPQDAALHAGLGRAHEGLGHSRAATRHYRDALRLRPGWTAVEEDLARLRARAPGARGAPLSAHGLPSRDAD